MTTKKQPIEKAGGMPAVNPQDTPPKFKLSSIGVNGLSIFNGIPIDEIQRDLQWPQSAYTYKKMTYSVPVNACLSLYENLISKVQWRMKPPKNATEEEKKQTEIIQQNLDDMDTSFRQVIKDCLSSDVYGFAVLEKVFRRRNSNSGSKYNDNLIGLKKLALRNQETIQKFIFDENQEVIGVKQNLSTIVNSSLYSSTPEIVIPRSKFLHITVGRNRGDPFGKSPLRDVYIPWTYLEVLSELEATGVQKDLSGIPVLRIPAQYLSSDASPDQLAILENLKNILRNLQTNSQSGVMLPSAVDDTTRTPLFDLSLLSNDGGKKNFNISEIKNFYQNQIYTGLAGDVLILGSNGVGSFALGQIKNSLTGSAIEAKLDNIVEAFNRDVIKHLYELNSWDTSRMCLLDYENLNNVDLETQSKWIQRIASVGMLPKTHDVINMILSSVNLDSIDDTEDLNQLLTDNTSNASQGMNTPFEGTRTSAGSGQDTSANNNDNAA